MKMGSLLNIDEASRRLRHFAGGVGWERALVATLSASACFLFLLIVALGFRRCSHAQQRMTSSPSATAEESTQEARRSESGQGDGGTTPLDDQVGSKIPTATGSSGGGGDSGPSYGSREGQAAPVVVDDILDKPNEEDRSVLARALRELDHPELFDTSKYAGDPFAVYRSIRDSSEFSSSVLVRLADYVDRSSEHGASIAKLATIHRESMNIEYDDNYCSIRIGNSLEISARLSVIVARCLRDAAPRDVLDKLDMKLAELPEDQHKHALVCVEVASVAWDAILSRMCSRRGCSLASKSSGGISQTGGILQREEHAFQLYAALLERASLVLCPESRGTVDGLRRAREQASARKQGKYVCIAAAAASLSDTHALLAKAM